jgi:hypothetical protein
MTNVLNTAAMLHEEMLEYHTANSDNTLTTRQHNIPTRYERTELARKTMCSGDFLLQQVQDLFHHGMNVRWSDVQIKIFNAFIDACLPKIYGDEWNEVKQRVMSQRNLNRIQQETLVLMARRNGKTFVTSGTAAALFLVIPNLSVAVFSVSERQSKMLMTATMERIEAAFELGTHVNRQGYSTVQSNKEMIVMKHPSGGKQVLGCYPGSVRVRFFRSVFFS